MLKKITESKYFWHIAVLSVILVYIYVEFQPLFSDIPRLRRYLQHDFLRSLPGINYLMESFSFKTMRFYHWNEFASSGSPSINEIGTYYFPNYVLKLFYVINNRFISIETYQFFTFAHYLLGGLGFFILTRSKIKSAWPALFGALFFISSSLMSYLIWQGYVFAIALLPWIIIFLEKYFLSKKWGWILLAAFISFQQLAICSQFFFYTMIFIAAYFLVRRFEWKRIFPLLIFYFLTICYSAIVILPVRELSELASRIKFFSYDYFNISANMMSGIWQLVLNINGVEENLHLYIGGVAVSLIAIYLNKNKSKTDWALLGVAVFLFVFGSSGTFLQSIIHLLPGLDSTREYLRINEIVVFILLILLVKAIATYRFEYKRDLISVGVVTLVIIFGYLVKADFKPGSLDLLANSIFGLFIFSLILVARGRNLLNDKSTMILASILILLDLSRVVKTSQIVQEASFRLTPTGELARSEWFWSENVRPSLDSSSRIKADNTLAQDYNKFMLTHTFAAGSFSAEGGEFSSAVLKRYDDYLKTALINPNLLSIANINTPIGFLPRAFTQSCYQVETNDDILMLKLEDNNFSGKDFVFLSNETNLFKPDRTCRGKLVPVQAAQGWDKISFGRINNTTFTILFISDNWYPGWNAYVNGKKTEIIRANYTFKAVALSPGINEVEFRYEPESIRIGGLITWLSILASLVFLGVNRLMRRKE